MLRFRHRPSSLGKLTAYALLVSALLLLAGCREDMQNQPYYRPLRENDFYADKRSARPIIAGTVARGHLDADTYFYTGKVGNNDGDYLPFPVTAEVMARGQQRYNIYCTPCHDATGSGNGEVAMHDVATGAAVMKPPTLTSPRLPAALSVNHIG